MTLALPLFLRRRWLARLARPVPPDASAVRRRALLYKVDRLGDFVVALGALRTLVRHYGPDQCRLVVSSVAAPLAAAEFPGVARWELPPSAASVRRELVPLRARCAPSFAGETAADLVCLRHPANAFRDVTLGWLHADRWHGLGPRPAARTLAAANSTVLPAAFPAQSAAPWSRELLAHRAVVASALAREPTWAELRPTLASVAPSAGAAWVFCPFGHDRIRDYPAAHWLDAWSAADLPRAPLTLLGPPDRADELAALAAGLARRTALVPTVETALATTDFIARLAAARAVVTVESAAAHLAAALDKPAAILVGGGHHGWLAPWGDSPRQQWLAHPLSCYGCNWSCRHASVRCLADLPPAAVAAALRRLARHE